MQGSSFALTDSEGRALEGWTVIDGPWDVGSEERWLLRLADGRRAVLSRLSEALARDESVRRRWVRDVERLIECAAPSVAPILALGPRPDPRDPTADPPWRLRLEPEGESLVTWLARAPVPIDELAMRGAALADALHGLGGMVVRNLHPRDLIWTTDGRVVLTDVGLARVDLLSSHTASSLLISGSAYAAPEQLLQTVVDRRADLYSLGVILWQAATGSLPFGEGPALWRERAELPSLTSLRSDAPPMLDQLLRRLLAEDPDQRLTSAAEVAWVLRGGAGEGLTIAEAVVCQHCGASLRLGQRLCLACGRVGVRFAHLPAGAREQWGVELTTLSEDASALASLREFIASISQGPLRPYEFVIGDVSLYSEQELMFRKRLPARLFDNLDQGCAEQIVARMRELGLDVRVVRPDRSKRWSVLATGSLALTIAVSVILGALGFGGGVLAWTIGVGMIIAVVAGMRASSAAAERRIRPLYQLRAAPAALPASDPLVARIAALLDQTPAGPTPADVRAQLGELALSVQRLVDRRAELTEDPFGVTTGEFELLTAPVEPLIGELERRVGELARCDCELAELDEATMVRALASVDARLDDPGRRALERERLLDGLDRLRSLEDRRIAGFHRLLEASLLLRRAVDLGLGVHDPVAEQERRVKLALAALGTI